MVTKQRQQCWDRERVQELTSDAPISHGICPDCAPIAITDNTVYGGDKTIGLALSSPAGFASLGIPNTAILTVADNETQAGSHWFTFNYTSSEQTITIPAGATNIQFTVKGAGGGGGIEESSGNQDDGQHGHSVVMPFVTSGLTLRIYVGGGGREGGSTGGATGAAGGWGIIPDPQEVVVLRGPMAEQVAVVPVPSSTIALFFSLRPLVEPGVEAMTRVWHWRIRRCWWWLRFP